MVTADFFSWSPELAEWWEGGRPTFCRCRSRRQWSRSRRT